MRILLLEEDTNLIRSIRFCLGNAGYIMEVCQDGLQGYELIERCTYDLIILDHKLPHVDGLTILKRIQILQLGTPVILLTTHEHTSPTDMMLTAHKIDYLIKPFAMEDLLVRVKALTKTSDQSMNGSQLSVYDVTLYLSTSLLVGPTGSCVLTEPECTLAKVMLSHPAEPLSRSLLLSDAIDPANDLVEGNLDNYIYFFRKRLVAIGSVLHIHTLHSIGYILQVDQNKKITHYT